MDQDSRPISASGIGAEPHSRSPARSGGVGRTSTRSHDIAAPNLPLQPDAQRQPRVAGLRMRIDAPPAKTAEAAPFAHKRDVVEQGRFNGKNVVARHIARGVHPLENKKLDALSGGWRGGAHKPDSRGRWTPSNAKFESIETDRFESPMIDSFKSPIRQVSVRYDDRVPVTLGILSRGEVSLRRICLLHIR